MSKTVVVFAIMTQAHSFVFAFCMSNLASIHLAEKLTRTQKMIIKLVCAGTVLLSMYLATKILLSYEDVVQLKDGSFIFLFSICAMITLEFVYALGLRFWKKHYTNQAD